MFYILLIPVAVWLLYFFYIHQYPNCGKEDQ